MRMTLAALACDHHNGRSYETSITVQIRPSRGMQGDHCFTTGVHALRSLLKRRTDLSAPVIDGFMSQLRSGTGARISGVEVNDQTLREVGYFVD